ncbi:MAG: hypothetical protein IKH64_04380, partial [Prevotella sp.]|nr:hypothetical protein [Prevotella sp.]
MEGLIKEELIKRRGYIATLEAGYRFFIDNFKTIIKHMWPYALVFGVVLGIYEIVQLNTAISGGEDLSDVAGTLIMLPILFIAIFLLDGRMLMLFNDKPFKWNVIRYIKLFLWLMLIMTVLTLIAGSIIAVSAVRASDDAGAGIIRAGALSILVFIALLIIVFLPYVYPAMKYLVEPQTHFRNLIFKGWKKGFKHWGYIFITVLLLYLCIMVISLIISIPLAVCTIAQNLSVSGVLEGDASGMPSYFSIIFFIVAVLTFFVY